jgi:carbohydrate-binding DOMON domain-containing protein
MTMSTAASSDAPVSQHLAPLAEAPRSDCAVTGDLAGDGNPAEIAAILCAGERR